MSNKEAIKKEGVDIEEILKIIEKLDKEIDEERKNIKAEAYHTRLEDIYAIELRDKFNINAGKYDIIATLKHEIYEIVKNNSEEV